MMRMQIRSVVVMSMVLAACGVDPAPAPPSASVAQEIGDPCLDACRMEQMACIRDCAHSPDGGDCGCPESNYECRLSCPNGDNDLDGVPNGVDNCPANANANQADCDGDHIGDVCDTQNANYQAVTSDHVCWTDKDQHVPHFNYEDHVQHQEHDVSNCHAPDRWVGHVASSASCFNISDQNCCLLLSSSIASFGDSPALWCGANRGRNLCH